MSRRRKTTERREWIVMWLSVALAVCSVGSFVAVLCVSLAVR